MCVFVSYTFCDFCVRSHRLSCGDEQRKKKGGRKKECVVCECDTEHKRKKKQNTHTLMKNAHGMDKERSREKHENWRERWHDGNNESKFPSCQGQSNLEVIGGERKKK